MTMAHPRLTGEAPQTDRAGAMVEPPPEAERSRERHFWVRTAVVVALGAVIVGLLGSALLSISHAPAPHHVAVGYVGPDAGRTALAGQAGDALDVVPYGSRAAAVDGIHHLDVYGALVTTGDRVELLKSTAAAPQVASVLTALVTSQTARTQAPTVTDVSPLPAGDSAGSSIAILLQVVVLAGTIGAMSLGRLVPRYRARWGRGELPGVFLLLYALLVGFGTAGLARAFGIGADVRFWKLGLSLALVNIAVAASIAGLVALVGSAGAPMGGVLYFLLGSPISGASTALPMMPTFWRHVGQALPPGAGATLLRRVLYFPDASLATPLVRLCLYASIGMAVVGVANLISAGRRTSLANLPA
jgi:hypothetical protein